MVALQVGIQSKLFLRRVRLLTIVRDVPKATRGSSSPQDMSEQPYAAARTEIPINTQSAVPKG